MTTNNFNYVKHPVASIILMIIIFMMLLLQLSSCKKEEPSKLETDRIKLLLTSTTWKIQTVTVDGVDQTSMYSGLTLKFTDTQYTTTNGKVVWPASGVWIFADNTGRRILRGDNVEMSVQQIDTDKLVLNFTWATTTLGPGRLSSMKGKHVFAFVK